MPGERWDQEEPIDWEQKTLAFIGAGKLTQCLLAGIIAREIMSPQRIRVTNRQHKQHLQELAEKTGVIASYDKAEILAGADVVIVAVKPADAFQALTEISRHLDENSLLISVMAGISLDFLFEHTNGHKRLVRAMPNTAGQVGQSATALCPHPRCDTTAFHLAVDLFNRIGITVTVSEDMFDAVTAVSGSGPAYIYFLLESMMAAAQDLGLPAAVARDLVIQTAIGAGAMLASTGLPPNILREQVTSPSGTTAAALQVFDDAQLDIIVRQAVRRAAERAKELAGK